MKVYSFNLAHESLISSVVRQLLPTLSAHKAGLSTPLQNQRYPPKNSVNLNGTKLI